jgi:hypothetical protein
MAGVLHELVRIPLYCFVAFSHTPLWILMYTILIGAGLGSVAIYFYLHYLAPLNLDAIISSCTFIVFTVLPLELVLALSYSTTIVSGIVTLYATLSSLCTYCETTTTPNLTSIVQLCESVTLCIDKNLPYWPQPEKKKAWKMLFNLAPEKFDPVAGYLTTIDTTIMLVYANRNTVYSHHLRFITWISVVSFSGFLMPMFLYNLYLWPGVVVNTIVTLGTVSLLHAGREAWDPLNKDRHTRSTYKMLQDLRTINGYTNLPIKALSTEEDEQC